ncbi:MAG: alpha/beta hydrolase family protein [Butyricicoccus sp.]
MRLDHGVLTHFPAPAGRNNLRSSCPGGGCRPLLHSEAHRSRIAFARDGVEAFVLEYDCGGAAWREAAAHAVRVCRLGERTRGTAGIAADHVQSADFRQAPIWQDCWRRRGGTDWFRGHGFAGAPMSAVLCYPVVSARMHRGSFVRLAGENAAEQRRFSLETLVSALMPRTFLWHTLTDATVPVENTLLLEAALRRENISHELHLFPHGVHGLALADLETADPMKGRVPDRHINRWQALCAEWLKEE